MQWALQDAGIAPEQVDYINAHGTGTAANDAQKRSHSGDFWETPDSVLVSSTKSMHGHTLGAAGAVEAVATLLALKHGVVPPTVNFGTPDPACNLNVVRNRIPNSGYSDCDVEHFCLRRPKCDAW